MWSVLSAIDSVVERIGPFPTREKALEESRKAHISMTSLEEQYEKIVDPYKRFSVDENPVYLMGPNHEMEQITLEMLFGHGHWGIFTRGKEWSVVFFSPTGDKFLHASGYGQKAVIEPACIFTSLPRERYQKI